MRNEAVNVNIPPVPPARLVSVKKAGEQPDIKAMTRADQRIVFAKINDHYGDETTGYVPPWDDVKIAADLGVPREWVTEVRETHFGVEHRKVTREELNATMRELRNGMTNLQVKIADLQKEREGVIVQLRAVNAELEASAGQVEALASRLDEVEKTYVENGFIKASE